MSRECLNAGGENVTHAAKKAEVGASLSGNGRSTMSTVLNFSLFSRVFSVRFLSCTLAVPVTIPLPRRKIQPEA